MSRRARLEGSSFLRRVLAFVALAPIAACGADFASDWEADDFDGQSDSAVELATRRGSRSPTGPVTPDLRAKVIRTVQRDAPASYEVSPTELGGFRLTNEAQQLVGTLDTDGLVVSPADQTWSFLLRTTGVGCAQSVLPLGEPTVKVDGNRIRVVRPGIEEWYVNGPLGLEQGFDLDQAPGCAGTKVIEMSTGGDLVPKLVDDDGDGRGETVHLLQKDGKVGLIVSDLYVHDADDRAVPAWMTVRPNGVTIHVDDAGAKYPLTVDPLIAVLQQKILTPGGVPGGQFGYGLAMSGNTVVIGSPKSNGAAGLESGTAYVFVRNNNVWTQQAELKPAVGQAGQWFGFSVAFSGDTAVLTAPFDNAKGIKAGAAYVFVRNGNTWTEEAKLSGLDTKAGDVFGVSGAILGDRALIGAHGCDDEGDNAGAAYLFTRTAGVWNQTQKLTAQNDGEPEELFGATVALSNETLVVGAVYDDDLGTRSGSIYTFGFNGSIWTETQKLTAFDGAAGDLFSYWAAISGDTLLVSAASHDLLANGPNPAISNAGAAYVYVKGVSSWNLQQKLVSPAPKQDDLFGSHVALEGGVAIIGAQQSDIAANNAGAAYWWVRDGSVWSVRHELKPGVVSVPFVIPPSAPPLPTVPAIPSENFGWTVAVSGDTVAVGAPFDVDNSAANAGSVYIFVERKGIGDLCGNDQECASGICVDGVCCKTTCGGGVDDCQACSVAEGSSKDGECEVLAAGTSCRDATGVCDVAEACNGVDPLCPDDVKAPATTVCRAALPGGCDVEERCDGLTNDCPADTFAPPGAVCRAAVGACDIAETCTGFAPVCPADTKVVSGTQCREAGGPCDAAEFCDGASGLCPVDGKRPAGTGCRDAAGACDLAEICDGINNACPVDSKRPQNTVCNESNGACDPAERCDGVTDACPADQKSPVGTVCGPAQGDCDAIETCDGTSDTCPEDLPLPANTTCRVALGVCDAAESCDGTSKVCPPDEKRPATFECRPIQGVCDKGEFCDGTSDQCPEDEKEPAAKICRGLGGLCDEIEVCDGMSDDCPPDLLTGPGILCRAIAGDCDVAEACTGTSKACPADQFRPGGEVCRPVDDECDVREQCTGLSAECPEDLVREAGAICRPQQDGICDIADVCDGTTKVCPDEKVDPGIPCRAPGASGPPVDAECDITEFCGGGNICPEDEFVPNGTACEEGTKICVNGQCVLPPPPEDAALYGGGPLCSTNAAGSSSSRWPLAFLAIALGSLRRRFRSARP